MTNEHLTEKKEKKKYKTKNWPEYDKALKARGSLTVWLDKEMTWQAPPTGKRGRQQQYSDKAIEFCLTLKVLFGLPLRQSMGLVESVLKLSGLDWEVPQAVAQSASGDRCGHI